jgi:hypothetical protein
MASILRFDNWQNSDGTSIATTDASGNISFAGDATFTGDVTGFSAGKILQVVATNKNDVFTSTSGSFADITGLSVTITPTSATSKILVLSNVSTFGTPNTSGVGVRLLRDSTTISAGSTATAASDYGPNILNSTNSVSIVYLDSPATTSATVYKWQIIGVSGQTVGVNRDTSSTYKTASNILVMEVSA